MGLGVKPRSARPSCCGLARSDLEAGLGGKLRLPPLPVMTSPQPMASRVPAFQSVNTGGVSQWL